MKLRAHVPTGNCIMQQLLLASISRLRTSEAVLTSPVLHFVDDPTPEFTQTSRIWRLTALADTWQVHVEAYCSALSQTILQNNTLLAMDSLAEPVRGACLFSRKRKLRCDRRLPRCQSCTRLRQDCSFANHTKVYFTSISDRKKSGL